MTKNIIVVTATVSTRYDGIHHCHIVEFTKDGISGYTTDRDTGNFSFFWVWNEIFVISNFERSE